mgnify:CR=1 FL=1
MTQINTRCEHASRHLLGTCMGPYQYSNGDDSCHGVQRSTPHSVHIHTSLQTVIPQPQSQNPDRRCTLMPCIKQTVTEERLCNCGSCNCKENCPKKPLHPEFSIPCLCRPSSLAAPHGQPLRCGSWLLSGQQQSASACKHSGTAANAAAGSV